MSANSRNHFTVLKQIDQLIEASDAEPDLGFLARLMALCSLPRTNPRQRTQYVRRNGPYTLYLTAGGGNKLPYGNIPRLLLAWACTEAVRTHRRELVLGRSLYEFMRRIGRLAGVHVHERRRLIVHGDRQIEREIARRLRLPGWPGQPVRERAAARGRRSGVVRRAGSLTERQPWADLGVSRATWYRRFSGGESWRRKPGGEGETRTNTDRSGLRVLVLEGIRG